VSRAAPFRAVPFRAVPFRAVVRSEWTKLWSVRSTWWCTVVYVLVVGAGGWLAAAGTDSAPRSDVAVQTALTGFGIGQLALVVLGVLVVTSEFASGMAQVSLTVVPRRSRLLTAKTVVVLAYCLVVSAVLAVVCALAARTLTAVPGGVQPSDPAVLRTLGLQVGAAALVGVLGVALGAVLRSTAGAVGLGVALVFVAPPALALVGNDLASRVSQSLPSLRVGEDAFLAVATSWQVGMAVVAGWAVGTWVLGAVLLERRDI
jgi:ABC-2 type transport system permease protein